MHTLARWIAIFLLCNLPLAMASSTPDSTSLRGKINRALREGQSLKTFYNSLSHEYGAQAVQPLVEIAANEHESDETRWASLFGIGRLAGKESLGMIRKFFSHSSWMLRDAALKTAAALDAKELREDIELRLKDDALIIRTTAVDTIGHLKLTAAAPKLVDALFDPINYHNERGLWIHKHILSVLRDFQYQPAIPKLVELLEIKKDEKLREQVVLTLEKLTGKSFPNRTIQEQVYLWKRNTLSETTF